MSEEVVYESPRCKIHKTNDLENGYIRAKKILNIEYPSPSEVNSFYKEYEVLNGISFKNSRNVFRKQIEDNKYTFSFEWLDGVTLKEFFTGKIDIAFFLETAIRICSAIEEIHQHKIIHRDINPYNIVINADKRIKIIDFGIATKIDHKQQYTGNAELLEGTIAYISPEQTGRMNRTIDYRTDFYSLGVTFYELLSGKLPFEGADAIELIHAHIAQVPMPVHLINKEVPEQLSAILNKLMAKKAEDRYLSAQGIKADLKKCLEEYNNTGTISFFPLAQDDFSDSLKLQQKLYGREKEIDTLLSSFEYCAAGDHIMMLVAGNSGTGKSALVNEVHKPITAKKGYFISGKFDQFQRAVPYYAFTIAFGELISTLLTENEQRLSLLKEKIADALGNEGKVITDVFPVLELLIGKQKNVTELKGYEAQTRFMYLFCRFIKAIAFAEHPLVLFIDDMQWIDNSSLQLFEAIAEDKEIKHLFVIGAYRDNEVNEGHPLMLCVNTLERKGIPVKSITISNLEPVHINNFISDSLINYSESVTELGKIVHQKTGGNAFFVIQFLKSLYDKGLIFFDYNSKHWECNIEAILALNMTDNVVALLADKIATMSKQCQHILKLAACIGNTFDVKTITIIASEQTANVLEILEESLLSSLIVMAGNNFKFVHDRVQQAAYSMIPEEDKSRTHHKIAVLLLENTPEQEIDEKLFDIVNHYNKGGATIKDDEKEKLRLLNFKAGTLAKNATAFVQAHDYFLKSIRLLKQDCWETNYTQALELHNLAAETAYFIADYSKMDEYISLVLQHAKSVSDKFKATETKILGLISQNKVKDALQSGLSLLNDLNVKFPSKVTTFHLLLELAKTKIFLAGRRIEKLETLPEATESQKLPIINILFQVLTPAYWTDTNLMAMIILRALKLSISAGTNRWTYYCYACYGALICELGELKNGYRFSQLAIRMLDRPDARETACRVHFNYSIYVLHWNKPLTTSLKLLLDAYHIGLETGDSEFASLAYYFYCQHYYLAGNNLDTCSEEMRKAAAAILKLERMTAYNYHNIHYQAVLNLRGLAEDPLKLEGEVYRESEMRKKHEDENDNTALYKFYLQKLMLGCVFGDYRQAINDGEQAYKRLGNVTAQYCRALLLYYECIARFGHYQSASVGERKKYLKKIKGNITKIKKWSAYFPDNQYHKYLLLKAEWNRIKGGKNVLDDYDAAIQAAQKSTFTQEEALAYELAGNYYDSIGKTLIAEVYLRNAYQKYRNWGAGAKLSQMEKVYPKYISPLLHAVRSRADVTLEHTNTSVSMANLDISTIVKATTTISGEVALPKFLDSLLKVVIENAGAQSGAVLLEYNGDFVIEAYMDINKQVSKILQHKPALDSGIVSDKIVKYVLRTKEAVLLDEACADIKFKNDNYLSDNKVLSVLCMPIMHQNTLTGILYLENNLITSAFTQSRINILNVLSGQIAISIYNSLLYDNLEQKVEERTTELTNEKKKTDELLYNILPYETAQELKYNGKAEAKYHDQVSILFVDIVGFTQISEKLTPNDLVNEIDICFKSFDMIIGKYNIEKIKTIGDAYMAASGLPVPDPEHAYKMVQAALEIRDYMVNRNKEQLFPGFKVRIGINSGSVVSGVVGHKKFQYDIWGDSVNTASRMQSFGAPNKVNISENTFLLLQDRFNCEYRGETEVKGKGNLNMYFVERN
jgi:predicted ATPase/class 3 adenylate cyclase